jgi:excisionase family DNA binding protein
MTAPEHPTQLVIVPLDQLETLLSTVISRCLHQHPPASVQAQPASNAAFRTRKEAAKALNISLTTLNARLHDGTIPFRRVGRRICIPESFFATLE